jgi:hypothetical protein
MECAIALNRTLPTISPTATRTGEPIAVPSQAPSPAPVGPNKQQQKNRGIRPITENPGRDDRRDTAGQHQSGEEAEQWRDPRYAQGAEPVPAHGARDGEHTVDEHEDRLRTVLLVDTARYDADQAADDTHPAHDSAVGADKPARPGRDGRPGDGADRDAERDTEGNAKSHTDPRPV